jgi:predicted SprT family Zn-dependent metalloprotease
MDDNQTALAYSELQTAYNLFNKVLFNNQLPSCIITLQRGARYMGYFSPKRFVGMGKLNGTTTDEIALNPEWFGRAPTIEIMQTLVHEQCHLWQAHFGTPSRSGYHNKEWANKMEKIGLMPSTTNREGGNKVGQHMGDYPIAGGLFHKVFLQHVANGGGFLWRDKFLPKDWSLTDIEKKFNDYQRMGIDPTDVDKKLLADVNVELAKNRQSMVIHDYADLGNTSLNINDTDQQSNTNEVRIIEFDNPITDRSNRWKYQCSCKINVWGKPELKLICGDCEESFKRCI